MTKHQNIIGVDPDVEKSGVAFLNRKSKTLEVVSLSFPELLDYLPWEVYSYSEFDEKDCEYFIENELKNEK